jgi:hypothetical protein
MDSMKVFCAVCRDMIVFSDYKAHVTEQHNANEAELHAKIDGLRRRLERAMGRS